MDTIFVLDTNRRVIDMLSNNGTSPSAPFFDDTYTSELSTGAETYEFTTLANTRTNITLEVGNYILFKYDGKFKLFQITETVDEHSEGKKLLTVYSEMAGMELLNDYCEPFTMEGNFIQFMNTVLQDTNWVVGVYNASLLDNIQKVEVKEPTNVYKLIQEYIGVFGGVEIEFRAEFESNQLVMLLVDCYANGERGDKTYRRFEYGEDIKGITRERNINDLATAVIGLGKNGADFKDIEWKKSNGKPCNKPTGQNFVVDVEANDIWNNGGKYIKTLYKSDSDDPATILQESWDYLQEIKQPKFDYDVDLALVTEDYQDIRVGDTNYVVDFDYSPPILLEARVGKLELSFSNPTDNRCTLSNYKELVSILTEPVDLDMVDYVIESKFPIGGDKIAQGAIGEGHINVQYYDVIKADIVQAGIGQFQTLIAGKADIEELRATNAVIENLKADKADITDLNATNGNITNLTSEVGNIKTLINGNLTSDNIQSLHITSSNTTIDNAVIKNAMIDTVSANKINSGILNTNNVIVQSEDGGILLSGSTQQFKDKEGHVRVQIGKDAQGNFTFCLFSQDGVGILLDETGIKTGAVPDGLIIDNMISDNANISGGKINISSLISEINGNESTIKSSIIKFDDTGQSLLVAFNSLKNKVETIENVTIDGDLSSVIEQVNTNTTQIGVNLGKIETLITNTTITKENGSVVQLKDAYNATVKTVGSNTTKIGTLETNYSKVSGDVSSVKSKQTALEQDIEGFKQTVSNTYVTKDTFNNLEVGGTNLLPYTDFSTDKYLDKWLGYSNTTNSTTLTYIESNKAIRAYSDTFEADTAVGIMNKTYISLKGGQKYTLSFNAISSSWTTNLDYCYLINNDDGGTNQRIPGVEIAPSTANIDNSRVSITFTPNVDIAKCRILIAANDETVETHKKGFQIKNIKLERGIKATDWSPMPSDTTEVITEVVSNTNSSINQKAGEILSTVSNTYATKKSVTDLTNNLTNNYSTTNSMNTAIDQKAGEILSTVNNTYSTKTELNSLSIGGRNLVLNTAFEGADYGGTDVPKWSCSNNVFIHQSSQGLPQGIYISNRTLNGDGSSGMYYQYIDNTKVKRNSTYTLSYYISVQTNVTRAVVQMRYYDADGNIIGRNTLGDYSGGESGTKTHTFKTLDDAYDRCALVIVHFGVNNDSIMEQYSIRIQRIMLEQSTKASQWTPAPEDVDEKFTKYSTTVEMNTAINQSAKNITLEVDKTYAKTDTVASTYATNKALVDMEKNITSSVSSTYAKKTDVSNTYATKKALTDLGDTIRNEVSSTYLSQGDANNTYATKSSLTQTENNLTLKFSSTGGYNMVRNSSFKNGTTLWAGQSDAKLILYQYNGTQCVRVVTTVDEAEGATGIRYNGNDIDIIQNRYYSLSFKMRSYSGVNTTDMKYNYITNSTSGNKKMSDQDEYRFSYQSVGGGYYRIKISFKANETLTGSGLIIGFTGVSNATANTTGFGITEVMFQEGQECMGWTPHPSEVYDGIVAIDKDGIQVTSGNSTVQTLMNNNGFYVRKPSGDTYNYLLRANADGLSISEGIVNIDKTGVKVTHSNGDYTKMESSGFKRYTGSTGRSYHYLMSVGTVNVRTGQTATVQLPNEFKGKSFQVIIAAFKVNIVSGWDSIYDIDSYATNKNTTNGTFEIVGMVNSSNGKEGTLDVSYVVIA